MSHDNIYARTQPSNPNQINWDTVLLLLNDKKLIAMSKDPQGKSIDYKKFSLVKAVLTYPQNASEGISQKDLDLAHKCANLIKINVRSGLIKMKTKKISAAYVVGHHPGVKNNPSV